MKEGWTYKKLGELALSMADGPFGSNLKKEHYTNRKEVRIIQLSNIGEEGWRDDNIKYTTFEHLETIKRSEVVSGDIVIAKMMPAGRAILCPNKESKYVLSSDAVRVTLKDGLNNRFILFSINSPYFRKQVYENVTGSGRVRTSLTKLRDCKIYLPSFSEQQSIVDYLDSAFAKIDAMKANAEKALNEAKALFQASLKEMLEPKKGWEEKKVKDLSLLITKGSSPKWQGNSYVNSEGILFVTSENVREGCLEFNPAKFVDNSFNIKQRRSILKKFDVLVNIVGASIGRAAIFDLDVENANINQAVCLIRLNWDKILPTYLCFFLNSDYAFKQYASMVKDAARANLSLENIGSLEIGIPSLSEQQSIVETLDSLKSKVDRLQENYDKISQECDALKQAILRQVFE